MQCAVCSKNASDSCSKCRKINYCSKECQKEDWKRHRPKCFPLRVESSEEFGRYLVSTRNIKQWEVILKEKPIVSGPSDRILKALCLSCFCFLEEPYYTCTSCKWPVCNAQCEKVISHTDFECAVFSKQSVRFDLNLSMPNIYRQVHVLRGLLLKEKSSKQWENITSLQSHVEEKMANPFGAIQFAVCVEFIQNTCKLTQFNATEIRHVLGAIAVNSFGGEDYQLDKPRSGAHLYKVASFASHNCVPNCYRLIDEKFSYHLRACVDIPAGCQVTTFYEDTWIPTYERQSNLMRNYFFSCSCKRCEDPTELGTYFSAVNCREIITDTNCSGYLIPIAPKDEDTEWRCNLCNRQTEAQNIEELNAKFQKLVDDVPEDLSLRNFQNLDKVARSYQKKVHPNHHLFLELEFDIAEKINNMLAINMISSNSQQITMLTRMIDICRHQLRVLEILRPGYSIFRGKVSYLLQSGLMMKLLLARPRPTKLHAQQEIKEIQEMRSTALTILSVEPAEGILRLVENLKDDSEFTACKLMLLI